MGSVVVTLAALLEVSQSATTPGNGPALEVDGSATVVGPGGGAGVEDSVAAEAAFGGSVGTVVSFTGLLVVGTDAAGTDVVGACASA
ncbi:MAG: hypothetical protein FWC87_12040 [Acidimicrobiaceae bacterium]|nr:hypothetical protein [Acidimicrobiaceae bacterium]